MQVVVPIGAARGLELLCPECEQHLKVRSPSLGGQEAVLTCENYSCKLHGREYAWPTMLLSVVKMEGEEDV